MAHRAAQDELRNLSDCGSTLQSGPGMTLQRRQVLEYFARRCAAELRCAFGFHTRAKAKRVVGRRRVQWKEGQISQVAQVLQFVWTKSRALGLMV